MILNPTILALSALVPTIVGFVYYNDSVFGKMWKRQIGMTDDGERPGFGSMIPMILASLIFGFMLATMLNVIVIHPNGLFSMLQGVPAMEDPNSALSKTVADLMAAHGSTFRTFKHGAFHGILSAIFFALPVTATSALYERRGWGYIGVSTLYWTICLGIMGGIISQFS